MYLTLHSYKNSNTSHSNCVRFVRLRVKQGWDELSLDSVGARKWANSSWVNPGWRNTKIRIGVNRELWSRVGLTRGEISRNIVGMNSNFEGSYNLKIRSKTRFDWNSNYSRYIHNITWIIFINGWHYGDFNYVFSLFYLFYFRIFWDSDFSYLAHVLQVYKYNSQSH